MKLLKIAQFICGVGLLILSISFALEKKYDHATYDLLLGAVLVYWSERP